MHRILVAIVLVVTACGKKDSADCERYAKRVLELGSPGLSESRVKSVIESARESCEHGSMPASEINCVIGASNLDESLKCHGLNVEPMEAPGSGTAVAKGSGSAAPPSDRARRAAFSMKIPKGWAEDPDPRAHYETAISISAGPTHSAMVVFYKKDTARELGTLASEAACKAYAANLAKHEMAIDAANFIDTAHGKACEVTHHTTIGSDIVHFTITIFAWRDGGELNSTCSFPGATEPEPKGCAAILESLAE